MRLLVCGGRDFENYYLFSDYLDKFKEQNNISLVISGGADGVDQMADDWAHMWYLPFLRFSANWGLYQKRAGLVRNQQMLDEGKPDFVFAFPTLKSKGTWDMIDRSKKAGIKGKIILIKD